jgi:hypothetical protein
MTDQGSLALPIPRSRPRFPAEPIVRSAEIDGCYRWTATRAWGAGPCVLWCLLNPSVADGKRDDPTMQRMIGFSYRWGFGSMIVTNVYPFIASDTKDLAGWWSNRKKTARHDLHEAWIKNTHVVSAAMGRAATFVAGWGNGVDVEDLAQFLEHARPSVDTSEHDGFGDVKVPADWMCLGKTGLGNPIHPLARGAHRVPDDAVLQTWREA